MILLGVDPGLADLGWCVVETYEQAFACNIFGKLARERLIDYGHIVTEPGVKSHGKSNDNLRRIREQSQALMRVFDRYPKIDAICAEAQSWPRGAPDPFEKNPREALAKMAAMAYGLLTNSTKIAMSWGVLGALSVHYDVPVIQVSPQTMRARLLGQRKGSKANIQNAIIERYGIEWLGGVRNVAKSNREHITDAIGAVVACLEEEPIRRMRNRQNPLGMKTKPETGDIDFR